MKPTVAGLLFSVLILSTGIASGQQRKQLSHDEMQRYVVSAKAGEVNLVEGDVTQRAAKSADEDWQMVIAGDQIADGETVKTGSGSRLEVLLNPGSYFRVSENSEFTFKNTALDHLAIELTRGSAIVEAAQVKGYAGTLLSVATPSGDVNITNGGIYRIDTGTASGSAIEVFKGAAKANGSEIKEGKKASLGGGTALISDFNKKDGDQFDTWSKDRAKNLVEANSTMVNPSITSTAGFMSGPGLFYPGGFFGSFGYFGANYGYPGGCGGWWVFDPFFGSNVYLPNGFDFCPSFFSPYGWSYGVLNDPIGRFRRLPPPTVRPGTTGKSLATNTRPTGSNRLGVQTKSDLQRGSFGGWNGGRNGAGGRSYRSSGNYSSGHSYSSGAGHYSGGGGGGGMAHSSSGSSHNH